jgi:uncharacterized YceG family protein
VTRPDGGRPGGRHSEPTPTGPDSAVGGFPGGTPWPGYQAPRYEPARYDPRNFGLPPTRAHATVEQPAAGPRRSGLLDRSADETGPVVEPEWWTHGCSDAPETTPGLAARHGDGRRTGSPEPGTGPAQHPSAPLPPLPSGAWERLAARSGDAGDDDATVARPAVPGGPPPADTGAYRADDETDAHALDPAAWDDRTGGLEVIGAHVEERPRRGRRHRHAAPEEPDADVLDADVLDTPDDVPPHRGRHEAVDVEPLDDDEIPVEPYDHRSARARRRRRPVAVLMSLLVLAGLVVGIVIGGQKLLEVIDPSSRDYTGQGTGSVEIRVQNGDTLSDIARTLVEADVIASIGPFVDAAETNEAATGIQPGVYQMREQMSGQAALDQMLDPAARLLSRVTLPEGLTVEATLARLAESTGMPLEEFRAAAEDPAALGLPAWANGLPEGFLFPATYDVEPDTTPAEILRAMVSRAQQAFAGLGVPEDQLLAVLTEASLVQAEAATAEDMAKVARVIENRIAIDMPLQFDTTVNYANGKGGITTTPEDRANPSPYNTYLHAGLPPGPINNPGDQALQAALNPAEGDWLFFVVVDPDTGETRFAATAEEHAANVELFRQWLRENPDE